MIFLSINDITTVCAQDGFVSRDPFKHREKRNFYVRSDVSDVTFSTDCHQSESLRQSQMTTTSLLERISWLTAAHAVCLTTQINLCHLTYGVPCHAASPPAISSAAAVYGLIGERTQVRRAMCAAEARLSLGLWHCSLLIFVCLSFFI